MPFNFNEKSSLLLIFFVHGLIFTLLLLFRARRTGYHTYLWLGFFVLLCALYIAPFMLGYAGWYGKMPYRLILFYIPFQQVLLLPPVLFFYTRSLLDNSFVFSSKDAWHLLPAGLYALYSLFMFVADNFIFQEPFFYRDGRDRDFDSWYQMAGFVSLVIYLVLSLRIYHRYRRITYEETSFADSVAFRWLRQFLVSFFSLLILRGVFFLSNPEWGEFGSKFWYYLCFSILFYYVSLSGLLNSARTAISLGSQSMEPDPGRCEPVYPVDVPVSSESKEMNDYPDAELAERKAELSDLMTSKKLYLNPTLTLAEVAQSLNVPPKKVSKIIGQGFGMNFNDYVNRHRTEEVIRKLETGEHSLQNLLGIAYDAGFNSKSTFNRAFKKHTSLTPKEFLEKLG